MSRFQGPAGHSTRMVADGYLPSRSPIVRMTASGWRRRMVTCPAPTSRTSPRGTVERSSRRHGRRAADATRQLGGIITGPRTAPTCDPSAWTCPAPEMTSTAARCSCHLDDHIIWPWRIGLRNSSAEQAAELALTGPAGPVSLRSLRADGPCIRSARPARRYRRSRPAPRSRLAGSCMQRDLLLLGEMITPPSERTSSPTASPSKTCRPTSCAASPCHGTSPYPARQPRNCRAMSKTGSQTSPGNSPPACGTGSCTATGPSTWRS